MDITTTVSESGHTTYLSLDGIEIGGITGCTAGGLVVASGPGTGGTLRFPDYATAEKALISNHLHGWWTGEL